MDAAAAAVAAAGPAAAAREADAGALPERMQRRDEARRLAAAQRRQHRQEREVAEETQDFFAAALARERAAVEELLRGDRPEPGPEPEAAAAERLEAAAARLQGFQKLLNDSVAFVAAYDLRQGQEALARLQAALAERRRAAQPKKRFAFTSRRKEAAPAVDAAAAAGRPASPPRAAPGDRDSPGPGDPDAPSGLCGFAHVESRVLEKGPEELRQRDVLLTELRDCTVRLRGNPNTLRLHRARGCTVLCGPVSTSVFLEDCSDCVLAVACQQLRVHTTRDTRVFLHVTSRAIVEDCRGIQFAPFTWSYPGMDRDFESSGLDRSRNHWDDVDDFNWLVRDQASPNWSLLPEEERARPWD
ncbi:tubulin-specific chaperone C [Sorex fumeus]|uniref:tubulin-specific chaperone C n=1 Tax=Sorex fumeus TaxID=62283 RepID=UPI0024ADC5E1|nr:tubulin-specific chaperone C [Sorex fumeus]